MYYTLFRFLPLAEYIVSFTRIYRRHAATGLISLPDDSPRAPNRASNSRGAVRQSTVQ